MHEHTPQLDAADHAALGRVALIIPALNEQESISRVLAALPPGVGRVIVVDNGSTDRTAALAREAGATVVREDRRGYGFACLAGLSEVDRSGSRYDVVAFLDADLADDPGLLPRIVQPILAGEADLVIGSRTRGQADPGSLTLPQRLGNHIATSLLGVLCRVRFTDLGPFRAIRRSALTRLAMDDTTYGWTVQMQIRAARHGLRCLEVPVPYRRRVGRSKISGTLRGVLGAGTKIPLTILRETLLPPKHLPPPGPREQLIVFARLPVPGRTKTRLIPALGPRGAADAHHRMTQHTLQQVDAATRARPALAATVRITGGSADQMANLFGRRDYRDQGEGDLGHRLHHAAVEAFAAGAHRVVFVGTDCPSITPRHLHQAFDALHHADVVLGPAHDGGYYLLGLARTAPTLFQNIDWGTGRVLEQTLAAATRAGLSVTLLEPLHDVDRPEDLPALDAALQLPKLSVVIPALNEEAALPATLHALQAGADEHVEIVLADGGSTDATVSIGRQYGVTVVISPPGRARQMNAGAARATGDLLLFCHADTLLPPDYPEQVRQAMRDSDAVGGAFTLAIDARGRLYRWIERAVRLRTDRLHLPYGDQAIFVRRSCFEVLHGYDEALPVMEDYDFVRRLRRRGHIVSLDAPARTHARYWRHHGPIRATLRNTLTIAAHTLGVSPRKLARLRHG